MSGVGINSAPAKTPTLLERLGGLERAMVKVRWFGVIFAFFQIYMGTDPPCPAGIVQEGCEPLYLRPVGYSLAAGLAVANLLIHLWLRRDRNQAQLQRTGLAAFLLDHVFLIAFTYLYSHTETTTIWIILYILPLEGALRYAMRGSMASVGFLAAAEIARDFWREAVYGFEFQLVPGTSFRLGIMLIIGMVAGIMSRNLEREREEVERRAEREVIARREQQMLYEATLAGVSTEDFDVAMQRMVETIGREMGFESLALALIEEEGGGAQLRVVAGYQYPSETIGRTLTLDEGVGGPVARDGIPAIVNDVSAHPTYLDWAPWCQSQMATPVSFGETIIGVLSVESPDKDAFSGVDLESLTRIAIPVAAVVENAKILAKEKEAVERLTELDRMKSDFIAITSHELRTPLTSIRGFIQTILRPDLEIPTEEMRAYLEVIDRQSRRLHYLVEDLLFISQLEAGVAEVRPSPFELLDLINEVVADDFQGTVPRIVIGSELGDGTVLTDRDRLRRVITDLVDNALKYSPADSLIHVTVRRSDSSILIEVRDQGIGIPAQEHERIFERFHQVGGSLRRKQQGFGLGLYISRRIVEALGGTVTVSSREGRGSTFTVELPPTPAAVAAS